MAECGHLLKPLQIGHLAGQNVVSRNGFERLGSEPQIERMARFFDEIDVETAQNRIDCGYAPKPQLLCMQ